MSHSVQDASPQERTVQAKRLAVLTLRNPMLKKEQWHSRLAEIKEVALVYISRFVFPSWKKL